MQEVLSVAVERVALEKAALADSMLGLVVVGVAEVVVDGAGDAEDAGENGGDPACRYMSDISHSDVPVGKSKGIKGPVHEGE